MTEKVTYANDYYDDSKAISKAKKNILKETKLKYYILCIRNTKNYGDRFINK